MYIVHFNSLKKNYLVNWDSRIIGTNSSTPNVSQLADSTVLHTFVYK